MSARVSGLGHIGIFCHDLDRMADFYEHFIGMTVTKKSSFAVFLSADPEAVDHEIALMGGRPSLEDPHLIQQISMRVDTLEGLRDFHRRVLSDGYKLDMLVSHGSAIGCYFRDPEGNPTEVFWLTGFTSWAHLGIPIDIQRPDDEVMEEVEAGWNRVKDIRMGEQPDPEKEAELMGLFGGLPS